MKRSAPARISRPEWLWLSALWLAKVIVDLIFIKFQLSELTFDNIDYLDHAKQYLYSKDAAGFYQIFLQSFGRLRSPFESWLIYVGKLACPKLSFGTIGYILQTVSALALAIACLAVAKRTANLLGIRWHVSSSAVLLAAVLFAPLTVGLSRGTLVELMLVACMQLLVLLSCRLATRPTATDLCYFNIVLAWGLLTKFTFPLYIFLPILVLAVSALLRLQIAALVLSLLFQVLVQVEFCYNIVNWKPMIDNAHIQASLTSYGYLVPLAQEIAVNGLGLPLVTLLFGLLVYFCFAGARRLAYPYRWPAPLAGLRPLTALRENGAGLEELVISAAVLNFAALFAVHLHATNRMIRFFYFVLPVVAGAAVLLFSKAEIRRGLRTGIAAGFVGSSIGICLLFSVPTSYTVCSRPILSKVFNVGCVSADPVDGAMYAPHTANYHVFALVQLLEHYVAPGAKVVIINPNEYFNAQTFGYHLRYIIAQRGYSFGMLQVGVGELRHNTPELWKGAQAIIFKNFTTAQFDTLRSNGAPPMRLSPSDADHYNREVEETLARLHVKRIYNSTNTDGVVSVYIPNADSR